MRLSVIHRGRALPYFVASNEARKCEHFINGELWAIVSDEKTTLQTFAEYGLRFDIEENFLDEQSAGWNVQRSMIRDVCPKGSRSAYALSRLWFILAVATLYVSATRS